MTHEGTNYEHSSVKALVDGRCQFNYCPLCNDWYLPARTEHVGAHSTIFWLGRAAEAGDAAMYQAVLQMDEHAALIARYGWEDDGERERRMR